MFDNAAMPVTCAKCGHKTEKKLSWLKTHRQMICRCGATIMIDSKGFASSMKQADKSLANFRRSLRKMGNIKIKL